MNPLAFHCPHTGREVDIGLDVTLHRPAIQLVQPVTLRVVCPHCRKAHVWKIADGFIREPRAGHIVGQWRAFDYGEPVMDTAEGI